MTSQRIVTAVCVVLVSVCVWHSGVAFARQEAPAETTAAPTEAPTIATPAPAAPAPSTPEKAEKAQPFKPYSGTIVGTDVLIRTGPAGSHYPVAQFKKGQAVKVKGEKYGWAMIEPTPQCFCYIAKEFVTIKAPDTEAEVGKKIVVGEVTGKAVQVRAGSIDKVPPANANRVLDKLNNGELVEILGQRDEFYKIKPRSNWPFWVSVKYIKSGKVKIAGATTSVDPGITPPVQLSDEDKAQAAKVAAELKALEELRAAFKAEQNKDFKTRDYAPIRKQVDALLKVAESESVKKSVAAIDQQLAAAEHVIAIYQKSRQEDQDVAIALEQLTAIGQKLADEEKLVKGATVVKGRLEPSAIFTGAASGRRYLVLDKRGDIVCYAVAAQPDVNLQAMVGKQVKLVGKSIPDAFSKIRKLHVRHAEILPETLPAK